MMGAQSVVVASWLEANRVVLSKPPLGLHKRGLAPPVRSLFQSNATAATLAAFNKPIIGLLSKGCVYYGGVFVPCVTFAA